MSNGSTPAQLHRYVLTFYVTLRTGELLCAGSTFDTVTLPSVRLEDLVKQEVLLMKMDVEGWEFSVYEGAEKLISQHGVRNIVFEYSPGTYFYNLNEIVEYMRWYARGCFMCGY